MNRSITIVTVLIVVALVGVAALFSLFPKSPAPVEDTTNTAPSGGSTNSTVSVNSDHSKSAVKAAFQKEIAPYNDDNVQLQTTVVVGDYAIQVWAGDNKGGEALLKYDATKRQWMMLDSGGGVWPLSTLVNLMGVPEDVARALLAGLGR